MPGESKEGNMQHSIVIGGHNTYDEWGLVPVSRPYVCQPEVKTNYIDVPGGDGMLDYSAVLTGNVCYGLRKGSWEFWLRPGETWASVFSSILSELHGKETRVILMDDPEYFYTGRVMVNEWKSEEKNSKIVLDYSLDPYKYAIHSTKEMDWLWNDLFDNVIYYGRFDVEGSMERNLINPSKEDLTPTFLCSSEMTLQAGDRKHLLFAGENKNGAITLKPGDNRMTFIGNGRVLVDYSMGKKL